MPLPFKRVWRQTLAIARLLAASPVRCKTRSQPKAPLPLKASLYGIGSFLEIADERTNNMAQISRNEGIGL
jgi:hypothetical protein